MVCLRICFGLEDSQSFGGHGVKVPGFIYSSLPWLGCLPLTPVRMLSVRYQHSCPDTSQYVSDMSWSKEESKAFCTNKALEDPCQHRREEGWLVVILPLGSYGVQSFHKWGRVGVETGCRYSSLLFR